MNDTTNVERRIRQTLAAHFAVLVETNEDQWPSVPPSCALADIEMDEATLADHLTSIERMLLRRHQ